MKTRVYKFIWRYGVLPPAALTLYFLIISYFLVWLLPEYSRNVNAVFVSRAWKYSLLMTAVCSLVFFISFKLAKGEKLPFRVGREKLSAGDFILLLLPLTPVAEYVVNNQDILSPSGSVYVLAVFALFSLLFVILLPVLLGALAPTKTLVILGAAFTFMITGMASLSAGYSWLEEGSLKIQLLIFGAVLLVGWILYSKPSGRKFARFFVASFFIINGVVQLWPQDWGQPEESIVSENRLWELVGSEIPLDTPNIYLLVYDSYVVNETMLGYGIDNSAQEEYLESRGFKIYPRTYSISPSTRRTMSRILNASPHFYGDIRKSVSGDGVVHKILRSFGYHTYGIFFSDFPFRGFSSSYDFSFPKAKPVYPLMIKAILMGEFRFEVEFEQTSYKQFIECKNDMLKQNFEKPRFIYLHTFRPGHSQDSGKCLPDETERYNERLIRANRLMNNDVNIFLERDPGGIIIVAGDHGPYLTKGCRYILYQYDISEICRLDIQDRFGTFLAIKWPTEDFTKYDDITVIQDLFPAIFGYLFQDEKFLAAKVEARTMEMDKMSGAGVENGIIQGGINDGEPLFLNTR